jgi:molecular chaperone DnaJ
VARDASHPEIKRAYRKLTRKLHPDVNPDDPAAETRFKEVAAAYEVVGDADKRKVYDEFGEDGLKSGFDPEQARAYRQWQQRAQASESFGGARGGGAGGGVGAEGFDLNDLFGGGFGGRRPRPSNNRRGADIESHLQVTFQEAVLGGRRELSFSRPSRCDACEGVGKDLSVTPQTCPDCGGSGTRNVAQGPLTYTAPCRSCGGTGQKPRPACTACGGAGRIAGTARLDVKIPPGVTDGQTIRLGGQGMPGAGAGAPGDLLIRIDVASHPILRREGQDLFVDVPVTVGEAMLGAKIDVPTFQGTVALTVPRGSQSGAKLRLRGRGIPALGKRAAGDLYVVLRVAVPTPKDDLEQAEQIAEQLDKLYTGDVRAELRL